MKLYLLEKQLWTEADFDRMDWHDSQVYAIALAGGNYEFFLDIDYLFEWVCPTPERRNNGDMKISFWLAPCTLVFEQVRKLKINLQVPDWIVLEIAEIRRGNPRPRARTQHLPGKMEYDWTIETQQGPITFIAAGYRQYVRRRPVFSDHTTLDFEERGGISFGTEIE